MRDVFQPKWKQTSWLKDQNSGGNRKEPHINGMALSLAACAAVWPMPEMQTPEGALGQCSQSVLSESEAAHSPLNTDLNWIAGTQIRNHYNALPRSGFLTEGTTGNLLIRCSKEWYIKWILQKHILFVLTISNYKYPHIFSNITLTFPINQIRIKTSIRTAIMQRATIGINCLFSC